MQHDESELKFRANSAAVLRFESTDPTGFDALTHCFEVRLDSTASQSRQTNGTAIHGRRCRMLS
jgi:hypothetical protein